MTNNPPPHREPHIRVGIVLPEDRQSEVVVDFPAPGSHTVRIPRSEPAVQRITVACATDGLMVDGRKARTVTIRPQAADTGQPLVLREVIAGRGFHWSKRIDVHLQGDLELSNREGSLLVINVLPLEQYLMSVATSEMSAACPRALLEAQTIVARSWILARAEQKHRRLGFEVCNDDCCQRYQGCAHLTPHSRQAVENTRGRVLMYGSRICDARYSKSCGGMMETFETVWDGTPKPYLQNRLDMPSGLIWKHLPLSSEANLKRWLEASPPAFCSPHTVPEKELPAYLGSVDEAGHYYRWSVTYTQAELTDLLNRKLDLGAARISRIVPVKRGGSGRLQRVAIQYEDDSAVQVEHAVTSEFEIRRVFHPSFLYSSAFQVTTTAGAGDFPETFLLQGAGWGHGVGLCQIGALGMALQGLEPPRILLHYYPGSRLTTLYP